MTFKDLMLDQATLDKLTAAQDMASAVQILRESGCDITEKALCEMMAQDNVERELTEDALEDVAGGAIMIAFRNFLSRYGGSSFHTGSSGASHGGGGGRHG